MKIVLAIVVALAACSDKKPAQPPAAALPMPAPPKPAQTVIGGATKQLVTAVTDSWTSTTATLQLWQRVGTQWQPVGTSWPAVIGKTGSAWGIGMHGAGVPGREGPMKKEGDGKSPAGAFVIRDAFGYADEPPKHTKLEYTSTGRGDIECVDDPASEHYAQIVDRKQVPADWESAEQMMRDDALYTWVVDLAHNPERSPGKGSCIFMHVWSGPESSTLGCTAMEEPRLVELLGKLDPKAAPVFVLLPRSEYAALQASWGLPPL